MHNDKTGTDIIKALRNRQRRFFSRLIWRNRIADLLGP
jgi:hypothetical protein